MHNNLLPASRLKEISSLAASTRFKQQAPMDRFHRICQEQGVTVYHEPHLTSGFYVRHDPRPFIAISTRLHPTHREFVAFHELGHHLLGDSEFDANLFAFLALQEVIS